MPARKTREKDNPGLAIGELVIVHDEHLRRGLWKLRRIQKTIKGRDGQIRGAEVKVVKRDRQQDLLRRPIQLLYPLKVFHPNPPATMTDPEISSGDISPPEPAKEDEKTEVVHSKEAGKRSRRVTAQQADDRR